MQMRISDFLKIFCWVYLLLIVTFNVRAEDIREEEIGPIIRRIDLIYDGDVRCNIHDSVVLANIQLKEGKCFSHYLADRSIKSLYETNLFDFVSVKMDMSEHGEDAVVTFVLIPRPKISAIKFEGNKKIGVKVLRKKIKSTTGLAFSDETAKDDVYEIFNYYQESGYPEPKIDYEKRVDSLTGNAELVFLINEGRKANINSINFIGNGDIDVNKLRDKMLTQKWMFLISWIKNTGRFRREMFEADLVMLRKELKNHGYLDSSIDESQIKLSYDKKNRLIITIPLELGENKYSVGRVEISGNKVFKTKALEKILKIKEGDMFSPEALDKACTNIQNFYGLSGYLDTQVRIIRDPSFVDNSIDVKFDIVEGEVSYVGAVKLSGNVKTKNKVILRELTIAPGQKFSTSKMKSSQAKLNNTGFFSDVDLDYEDTDEPNKKNLNVNVQEANTGKVSLGGAISTMNNVMVFAEIFQTNFDLLNRKSKFQGGGQRARARIEVGTRASQLLLSFEEPFVYDKPLAAGIDLFLAKNEYKRSDNNYSGPSYDEQHIGMEPYLRKRLFELWDGRLAYHIERMKLYNVGKRAPQDLKDESGWRSISKVKFTLERDTRNSFVMPSKGSLITINNELAGGPFLGQTNFAKLELSAARWFPLSKSENHVMELIGKLGAITPYNHKNIPYTERYFLGGQSYMRGFEYKGIGPKDGEGYVVGGNSFGYLCSEYTTKLVGPVYFATFAEGGFVNSHTMRFNPKNYCADVGVGLRIMIQGAPLRLDWGFPVHTPKNFGKKDKMQFNFSFGVVF
ncbi:MAG: outer membrane protein assembly factor BamA [Puniceicoccales bacterium]|jgi:outer membrane protein insertion porin family|nr:outer membrane protein assembly factor BamA [Puniceicoccales bacterium]